MEHPRHAIASRSCVPALICAAALAIAGCGGGGGGESDATVKQVKLGESIVAKGASGQHEVRVSVEIEEGKPADLKGFKLESDEKSMTPWYVRTTQENIGDEDIKSSDPVPVVTTPEDDEGIEAKRIGLIGDFPKCKLVNVPDPFPAGATNVSCSVYLVRKGNTVDKVVYRETRFESKDRVYEWKVS
jgi:hypothetical protein